ncbi:hypothetical protein [Microbulbifer sp. VAAF005]|uniref:hypothetical protein n=1 Tax=Microbulbifer sp. VAAF005 TaxID=3034230 RepID=UPI0024AD394B|nr:hypothetical protein [Microbulbifer sp. VAAF005]WHI45973.1 hypothetical protein P0078_19975 [Microbulbifer sp. VAAF005]
MNSFLVSNIADRQHKVIYKDLGEGAIFDLSPSQHGWNEFSSVEIGDSVYVINKNLNVVLHYKVTKVVDGIKLDESTEFADKIASPTGGDVRVVFGSPVNRVDMKYPTFVRKKGVRSTKLNPDTYKMLQGFNCAKF